MKNVICALSCFLLVACNDNQPTKMPPRVPQPQQQTAEIEDIDALYEAGVSALSEVMGRKKVITERVLPEPPLVTPPTPDAPPPKVVAPRRPKAKEAKASGGDVCSRHNLRKVFVSRYKWRCKK